MKLLIAGHARHGKDTVADLISLHTGLTVGTSSKYAIFKNPDLAAKLGYPDPQTLYEQRHLHRQTLYEYIRNYNHPNPARLATELLSDYDIYVGIRHLEEYDAAKHLFDLKIWVDATLRVPLETSKSISVSSLDFDVVIENHTTLADLEAKVTKLSKALKC